MRRIAFGALVISAMLTTGPASASPLPAPGPERLVIRTDVGDLVFQLYPSLAPRHVSQITKLARAGVLDTTHFFRYERGFVLQLSVAQDRIAPLTPSQQALIQKIPLEASSVPHRRGVLSMARMDHDVNSGETSFSILLGPGSHLDGKYTIFGMLESGWDVLAELEKAEVDGNRPRLRLTANRIEVWEATQLGQAGLRQARPHAEQVRLRTAASLHTNLWIMGAMMLIGGIAFVIRHRVSVNTVGSLGLLVVLLGVFGLLLALAPTGQRESTLAAVVFVGLIAMFRLMNTFESSGK